MDSEQLWTRAHWRGFFGHSPKNLISTLFTVIAPLLLALLALISVGYHWLDVSILQNINGNKYLSNNVLILFIFVSYFIVGLSLALYVKDIFNVVSDYKGGNVLVKKKNGWALVLLFLAGVLVLIYIAVIIVGVVTGWKPITFRIIIEANKFVTIACFAIFVAVDLLIISSKAIEKSELDVLADNAEKINRVFHSNNDMDLSWWSTFLISFPTIFITAMVWGLLHFISGHPDSFQVIHDAALSIDVSKVEIDWYLFYDGIETGLIAASVILSQIIFAVLKLRYHYRAYVIDTENPLPTNESSVGKPQST
jgi:hypothetical protein